jgi:hypothetical protein
LKQPSHGGEIVAENRIHEGDNLFAFRHLSPDNRSGGQASIAHSKCQQTTPADVSRQLLVQATMQAAISRSRKV